MTYSKAYHILERLGTIDKIISEEVQNGAALNSVKLNIIMGIEYFIDFTNGDAFKKSEYWQDTRFVVTDAEKLQHRVVNAVNKALAEHQINTARQDIAAHEYLIASQR